MGFGNLRVFNDDRLIPGAVWPMHPHRDIEGLTYVVEGTFRHDGAPSLSCASVARIRSNLIPEVPLDHCPRSGITRPTW